MAFALPFLPLTIRDPTFPNAGYTNRKHKVYKEIPARLAGRYTGLDHPGGRIHILALPEAKRDAVWAQADEHDREGEGAALPQLQRSGERDTLCALSFAGHLQQVWRWTNLGHLSRFYVF
jgi:hypothetical protein